MDWHLILFVGFLVFSGAIQAMPEPQEVNRWWYTWLYKTVHLAGVNLVQAGILKRK
jgi:hypothetical protein